ncbi:unnamed protein product [Mytilus edulis]|uniref:Uncharacterized protein n=1 Tax=Mytilus edulis TaxID=6550 RepID=A0A8S3RMR4_MYTED|nr:unnamed protein product [Mytilus edulis]
MQQKVQCLQQRLDQLQQGVINYAQPVQQQHLAAAPVSIPQQRLQQQVSEVVHQQPNYPEPRFQPPSSVPRIQQHKMIGHPTSKLCSSLLKVDHRHMHQQMNNQPNKEPVLVKGHLTKTDLIINRLELIMAEVMGEGITLVTGDIPVVMIIIMNGLIVTSKIIISKTVQTDMYNKQELDSQYRNHSKTIAKRLTGQETVTSKDLMNFFLEKSFVPRSTHVTGIQMQIHRTVCKEMGWTDFFRYSLRPVNSPACLLNWRVLTSVLHFLTPEQQDMVAEGFNYNPRNPPETEELAQMNASFWPVFVNITQVESAILQKEGEEDIFVSEQKKVP